VITPADIAHWRTQVPWTTPENTVGDEVNLKSKEAQMKSRVCTMHSQLLGYESSGCQKEVTMHRKQPETNPAPTRSQTPFHRFVISAALVGVVVFGAVPPSEGATKTTKKKSKKTTTTTKVAKPKTTVLATTTTAQPQPSSTAPTAAATPSYAKIFAAAGSTESDLGSGYRFIGDSRFQKAVALSITATLPGCSGVPEVIPYVFATEASQGWTFTNTATGRAAVQIVMIATDEGNATRHLESMRAAPNLPTCWAEFLNATFPNSASRDNPSSTGKTVTFTSANARFCPGLPALGDDQVCVVWEQIRMVDSNQEAPIEYEVRFARFGSAILKYRDEKAAADRIAPILAAKLRSALK
jgi:hypothetical protein